MPEDGKLYQKNGTCQKNVEAHHRKHVKPFDYTEITSFT